MKKNKQSKINSINSKKLIIFSVLFIVFIGLTYSVIQLVNGTGPLASLLAASPSINETKTICTRRLDGKKECRTFETEIKDNVKTTTTTSEIISDTSGTNKQVEYKFEAVKKAVVDDKGTQVGNSVTIETRKSIDPKSKEEEVLSTVTTVQAPQPKDANGKPAGPGEVISEVRTGDISLGVTSYKSGDKDKKDECEKDTTKQWKNDSCQPKDTRSDESKCTKTESGQLTGNTWENGKCTMKVEPRVVAPQSTSSTGVNCDKGMCQTSGSPICYGSYASTGQYIKDESGNSTGDYDCRLCGDNGSGGVGFVGGAQSCKTLLSQNAPVVLGPSSNPAGLGLPAGTQTGSCLMNRGTNWVLAPVGSTGEGPNEGKYCDVTGNWVATAPKIVATNTAPKTPEAQCHAAHPGYIYGKNFDGEYVCVPRTNTNLAMMGNQEPCKPGVGSIDGKEVWIECSGLSTVKSYTFCYGGTGTFDDKGNCTAGNNSNSQASDLLVSTSFEIAGNGFGLDVSTDGSIKPSASLNTKPFISSAVGCLSGAALGILGGPIGIIGGCSAGAAAAGAGTIIGGQSNTDIGLEILGTGASVGVEDGKPFADSKFNIKPVIGAGVGCVGGGLVGLVGGPIGAIGGCTAGAAAAVGGVVYGSSRDTDSTPTSEQQDQPTNDNSDSNSSTGIYETIAEAPDAGVVDNVVGFGSGMATAGVALPVCTIVGLGNPILVGGCEAVAFTGGALFGSKATDVVVNMFAD